MSNDANNGTAGGQNDNGGDAGGVNNNDNSSDGGENNTYIEGDESNVDHDRLTSLSNYYDNLTPRTHTTHSLNDLLLSPKDETYILRRFSCALDV